MKNLILTPAFIVAFTCLFLSSCEKEKPLSELIIGKWEVEYVTQVIYENNVLKAEYKEYLDDNEIAMQLVTGGTGIYSESTDDYLFSWTFNGTSLTISKLSQETLVWNVEMNGDKLVWSYNSTDTENPVVTYEYLFTAKRVN
ncbi:MAG: hypothetical protein QG611_662 [Bacteroidota bacterium]|nr:hypothetical protein [Bacteroidota bacterium]